MPNPSRTIWFLTHHQHYDPRIYHIMSIYRDCGWHTVLFDPPEDQASSLEWAELASVPWRPLAPLVLHAVDRQIVSETVRVFLADVPTVEDGKRLQRRGSVLFQWTQHTDATLLTFQVDGELERYVYCPVSDALWSSPLTCSHAELTALAIAQAHHSRASPQDLAAQLPEFTLSETTQEYLLHRPAGYDEGEELAIDKANGLARRRTLPRRYHYQVDEFFHRHFDFGDFKYNVYEYIWELDLVRSYLAQPTHASPDVVFVSDLPVLPVGVMVKEVFNCKLVIDCHEWWSEQERIWNANAAKKIAKIDYWEKRLYAQCDAAITVSATLAQTMSKHFGIPFQYVPTCVFDLPSLPTSNPCFWQERADIPEEASVVLFQGGLSSNRNLENLMRATRYFADGQYLVICGDGGFRAKMEAVLKDEGCPDRVRMLGWQPQLELWQYTLHADLGIIPYTHTLEYFRLSAPNKLSEYHVCKVPMLVDRCMAELVRVVSEDKIGLVANLSEPEDMGLAIASTLADKKALAAYRAAYDKAAQRFTRSQCEVHMSKLLEME